MLSARLNQIMELNPSFKSHAGSTSSSSASAGTYTVESPEEQNGPKTLMSSTSPSTVRQRKQEVGMSALSRTPTSTACQSATPGEQSKASQPIAHLTTDHFRLKTVPVEKFGPIHAPRPAPHEAFPIAQNLCGILGILFDTFGGNNRQ